MNKLEKLKKDSKICAFEKINKYYEGPELSEAAKKILLKMIEDTYFNAYMSGFIAGVIADDEKIQSLTGKVSENNGKN